MQAQTIFRQVEQLKPEMIEALTRLIRIPAVAPENGGDGEQRKPKNLLKFWKLLGLTGLNASTLKILEFRQGKDQTS